MGLWDDISKIFETDSLEKRTKKFQKDISEIPLDSSYPLTGLPRTALRGGGLFLGAFNEKMGEAMMPFIPDSALEAMSSAIKWGVDLPPGQAINSWADRNPKEWQDIKDFTNIMTGWHPARWVIRGALNKGKDTAKILKSEGGLKAKGEKLFAQVPGAHAVIGSMETQVGGGPFQAGADLGRKVFGKEIENVKTGRPKLDWQGKPKTGTFIDKKGILKEGVIHHRGPRATLDILLGRDKVSKGFYGRGNKYVTLAGEMVGATLPALWASINPKSIALQRATGLSPRTLKEFKRIAKEGKPLDADAHGALRMKILMTEAESGFRTPFFMTPAGKEMWDTWYSKPIALNVVDEGGKKVLNTEAKVLFKEIDDPVVANRHLEHISKVWGLDEGLTTNIIQLRGKIGNVNKETSGIGGGNSWVKDMWGSKTRADMMSINKYEEAINGYYEFPKGTPKLTDTQMMTELMTVGGAVNRDVVLKISKMLGKEVNETQLRKLLLRSRAEESVGILGGKIKGDNGLNANQEQIVSAFNKLVSQGKAGYPIVKAEATTRQGVRIRVDSDHPFGHANIDSMISSHSHTLSKIKEAGSTNIVTSYVPKSGKLYITKSDVPDLGEVSGRTQWQEGAVKKAGEKPTQIVVKMGDTQVVRVRDIITTKGKKVKYRQGGAAKKPDTTVKDTDFSENIGTTADRGERIMGNINEMSNIKAGPKDYLTAGKRVGYPGLWTGLGATRKDEFNY
tara:strand:+ start:3148 stop:5349 length:2202 start_codon:yes stop_codon:yes gene_type:complete